MGMQVGGRWADKVRRALGGGPCAVCRTWQDDTICEACFHRFASAATRCQRCGEECLPEEVSEPGGLDLCHACRLHPPPFSRTVVALPYDFPWDGVLSRFKFGGAVDLAPVLATSLAQAVTLALDLAPGTRPHAVWPVPLSETRLRQRGYNQAWELARRVARHLDLPAQARGLVRTRSTLPQSELSRDERLRNVAGAFAVRPRGADLTGQRLALVDDVMTTGATLGAAAQALREAGALEVQLWVVARTPADRKPAAGPDNPRLSFAPGAVRHVPHRPRPP